MPRCNKCGAVIPGHNCKHCPPTSIVKCPECGFNNIVPNEAYWTGDEDE